MANAVETLIRTTVTKAVEAVAGINRGLLSTKEPHPFLTGIHEPMRDERTITDLKVTGTIPTDLDGRYVRIGPNPATPPNTAAYHWFMGDGMIHGVKLKNGKADWYRNRWIRSTAVSKALGEPEAPGPRAMFDTVNTNFIGHAGSTWAIVEAGGNPVRVGPDLETIAHDPFGGSLKGSFSAHPHLDPDTGEMHAICYEGPNLNTIRHVVIDKAGKVRREEPIAVKHGPMIHDCMITKNYVIILDLPVTFSMKRLIGGYGFPYAWNPEHQARVGLLPKEGKSDDVVWCAVDPCYVFHPANAFETPDGKVTLDVCAHDTMFAESTKGPDSASVPFERWTIDPAARSVARKVIDQEAQEFPRPNEARIGKPYRYAYTVSLSHENAFVGASTRLFKHDLEEATRQVHDFGDGRVPGEFVFVAKANARNEDDGWLMGYVIDTNAQTTDLVILDATNFEAAPQAAITIPHRIPPGFHGNWIAA
ncbi:MAG: carotenoid oxygenase family protein [Alphaproteobacteria bacterium]|nr:carotenoid oxygenase family protein [Alphaproteobacteria bacterium]